jgi:hypothetical protein
VYPGDRQQPGLLEIDMTKLLTLKDLYVAKLIVRNDDDDAQVYTIGAIGHPDTRFAIYLVWFEGKRKCGSWIDFGGSYEPTLKQIERSLMGGRLANSKDITGVLSELVA